MLQVLGQGPNPDEEATGSWIRAAVSAAVSQVPGHWPVSNEHVPRLQGREVDRQLGLTDDLGGERHARWSLDCLQGPSGRVY